MSKNIQERWAFYVPTIYKSNFSDCYDLDILRVFIFQDQKIYKIRKNLFSDQVFYLLEEDLNRTPFEMKTSACEYIYL